MEKNVGRRKKALVIAAAVFVVLFAAYWTAIYFLVSACLVPSFMEKLDAFERITREGYAAQVHTSDIITNEKQALSETAEWLSGVPCRKLEAESADGYRLVAEEFFPAAESHRWVLLLHGYTGWKEEMYRYACWYNKNGWHAVVPDLRCQGESDGDFIGMGWTDSKDCRIWLDYILAQDADAEIVLHGQSMGAVTALIMSGDESLPTNVKAVISDCAYTDAYSMFGNKITEWFSLPPFPFVDSACLMLLLRGGYQLSDASAVEAVKRSRTPTLFIHGTEDDMIDVSMAYALYDAAACDKELLIVEGAGHAQSQDKDPGRYYGAIEAFLDGQRE